jgi:F0F1-type ATP synthase assembly protein I
MPEKRLEAPFSMWRFAWELGYTLAIPLVGGVLLGHWLDGRLGTGPWLLVAGLVVGVAISSLAVVRQLNQAMAKINAVSKPDQEKQ